MPNRQIRLIRGALLLLLAAAPAAVEGQEGRRGPDVLALPASVRALGMGNAFSLQGRNHEAVFYNPAFVRTARGLGGGIHRFGDTGSLATLSGAAEWWGGGVGVGLRALGYAHAGHAPAGDPPDPALLLPGSFSGSELAASVAFARSLLGFDVGIGGTLVEQRDGADRGVSAALDLGAARRAGPVMLSLAVLNVGADVELEEETVSLARRIVAGASLPSTFPIGPLDLGGSAAIVHEADGSTVLDAGAEIGWWPIAGRTFVFRVGHRGVSGRHAATLGGGFIGDRISIDYAHQSFGAAGRVHRIGVAWR